MIKAVKMPKLGTTVDEVKILKWFKKEGDRVKRGEPLFEVETDKASMEVESFVAGYIKKIVAGEGETVVAGNEIAFIGNEGDMFEEVLEQSKDDQPAQSGSTGQVKSKSDIKISPMVKKLAEKHGVDITGIQGSGPKGLILKDDVMKVASCTKEPIESQTGKEVKKAAEVLSDKEQVTEAVQNTQQGIAPFSRIGKAIASTMTRSKATIPHVYFSIDVDATAMKEARLRSGKRISYNAMIVYSVAKCLKQFPYLASRYSDEGRVLVKDINIGIAAAKGDDLFVPVVKNINTDTDSIEKAEKEIQRLISSVNTGQLKQEDISGGVFTVSNLGSYGIDSFTAVINPPEAGILAVGAMKEKVVAAGGAIMIRPIINMTLSVDHRVVNGVYAADFLQTLKKNLERM